LEVELEEGEVGNSHCQVNLVVLVVVDKVVILLLVLAHLVVALEQLGKVLLVALVVPVGSNATLRDMTTMGTVWNTVTGFMATVVVVVVLVVLVLVLL
jgi:hypothetical protein